MLDRLSNDILDFISRNNGCRMSHITNKMMRISGKSMSYTKSTISKLVEAELIRVENKLYYIKDK